MDSVSMKKLIISCSVVLVIIVPFLYIARERHFDSYQPVKKFTPKDDVLRIAVIGDSWVSGGKLDNAIKETLEEYGIEAEITSDGIPGAKSRRIYRNLISSDILNGADYLVVTAGANDTAGHIGKAFYAHHMKLIVRTAIDSGVIPVVVEVPDYGIKDLKPGIMSSMKSTLFKHLYDAGEDDVIEDYRRALDIDAGMIVKFTIDYKSQKDLYANPSHLNITGSKKLARMIAEKIRAKPLSESGPGEKICMMQFP
jgi:lysophospholipase L1-like esterase